MSALVDAGPPVVEASADVDTTARLGTGTRVWHLAQIGAGATLGQGCVVGRGAYVGPGATVGDHCKIQNYALVYAPAALASGVFVGPAAVLTNDLHPRAVGPEGDPKRAGSWTPQAVRVGEGASLGARCVCVAPVEIGRWAMVAAGAVVTRDVPDFALVVGVPARQVGWVGRTGRRLVAQPDGRWRCEDTGERFIEEKGELRDDGA